MDKDILISVGIDYDEALERFAGAITIFEKFLEEMASIKVIEPLQRALTKGETEEAFRLAHTLKGNFGNLSVKPLYQIISPLVDELKQGNLIEAKKLYIELENQYEKITEGIRKAL
jgi:HPt (histidine-containing phosphotransfer) domain-containing protein